MPECIKCGDYTKFNGGLCFKCYKKEDSNPSEKSNSFVEVIDEDNYSGGLSEKDREYRYNMIKERIAETLSQELFHSILAPAKNLIWKKK